MPNEETTRIRWQTTFYRMGCSLMLLAVLYVVVAFLRADLNWLFPVLQEAGVAQRVGYLIIPVGACCLVWIHLNEGNDVS